MQSLELFSGTYVLLYKDLKGGTISVQVSKGVPLLRPLSHVKYKVFSIRHTFCTALPEVCICQWGALSIGRASAAKPPCFPRLRVWPHTESTRSSVLIQSMHYMCAITLIIMHYLNSCLKGTPRYYSNCSHSRKVSLYGTTVVAWCFPLRGNQWLVVPQHKTEAIIVTTQMMKLIVGYSISTWTSPVNQT